MRKLLPVVAPVRAKTMSPSFSPCCSISRSAILHPGTSVPFDATVLNVRYAQKTWVINREIGACGKAVFNPVANVAKFFRWPGLGLLTFKDGAEMSGGQRVGSGKLRFERGARFR